METISPQFICFPREMASKMRRRVSSPSALEILSICKRSISERSLAPAWSLANCGFCRHRESRQATLWKKRVTIYFDTHLNVESSEARAGKARKREGLSSESQVQTEANMKRLEGKVAVVTGGNSGIGLATAKRLQEEGARVAISGRNKKTLDEAVKTLGNGVVAVQADGAKLNDTDKLYGEVSQKVGKNDVLFVNAGVAKLAALAGDVGSIYDR